MTAPAPLDMDIRTRVYAHPFGSGGGADATLNPTTDIICHVVDRGHPNMAAKQIFVVLCSLTMAVLFAFFTFAKIVRYYEYDAYSQNNEHAKAVVNFVHAVKMGKSSYDDLVISYRHPGINQTCKVHVKITYDTSIKVSDVLDVVPRHFICDDPIIPPTAGDILFIVLFLVSCGTMLIFPTVYVARMLRG